MTTTPLVELTEVKKSYNGETALNGLNLSVQRGEFVAVMGPSGCGKTTALRILAGFEKPDSGEVRFNGARINDLPPWRREMPMVWQNLALFPFLTTAENVEFGLRMRKISAFERRKIARQWLEKLAIAEFSHCPVSQLSGGQRQRVALARTLALGPDVLLLDEPLSALDANMVVHMQGVLSQLQRDTGVTFLYVTHSRSEAFAMADRVAVMGRGRVQQAGTPREIYRAPCNRFVAKFLGGNNIFSGRIKKENSELLAETNDGVFRLPSPENGIELNGRARAEFVVSAADAKITAAESGTAENPKNALRCRYVGEEFAGGSVLVHLRTAAGTMLTAQVGSEELDRLGDLRGQNLIFEWVIDKGRILPETNEEDKKQ